MQRREFITLLGGAAVMWPRSVIAETPAKVYRIGLLSAVIFGKTTRYYALPHRTPNFFNIQIIKSISHSDFSFPTMLMMIALKK